MNNGRRAVTRLGLLALLVVALVIPLSGCEQKAKGTIPVAGKQKSEYPDLAKVSMMDAVSKAQEKYPGKALEVGLEEEDGYLVYEVEIVGQDRSIMEVKVDAGNGAVLAMEKEKEKK